MPARKIADRIDDKLGEHFVVREPHAKGTLFLAPDPNERGKILRLLITREASSDYEDEMPEAVDRAIKLLREQGGGVMIRVTRAGELVVRRAVGA